MQLRHLHSTALCQYVKSPVSQHPIRFSDFETKCNEVHDIRAAHYLRNLRDFVLPHLLAWRCLTIGFYYAFTLSAIPGSSYTTWLLLSSCTMAPWSSLTALGFILSSCSEAAEESAVKWASRFKMVHGSGTAQENQGFWS